MGMKKEVAKEINRNKYGLCVFETENVEWTINCEYLKWKLPVYLKGYEKGTITPVVEKIKLKSFQQAMEIVKKADGVIKKII